MHGLLNKHTTNEQHSYIAVVDPEGVQWVPWNPSFGGLPLKILCANVLTLELRTLASK